VRAVIDRGIRCVIVSRWNCDIVRARHRYLIRSKRSKRATGELQTVDCAAGRACGDVMDGYAVSLASCRRHTETLYCAAGTRVGIEVGGDVGGIKIRGVSVDKEIEAQCRGQRERGARVMGSSKRECIVLPRIRIDDPWPCFGSAAARGRDVVTKNAA